MSSSDANEIIPANDLQEKKTHEHYIIHGKVALKFRLVTCWMMGTCDSVIEGKKVPVEQNKNLKILRRKKKKFFEERLRRSLLTDKYK